MTVYIYLAIYVAAVGVVLAGLFLRDNRLRAVAALMGALAVWLPFTIYKTSLGHPSPFSIPGTYELLGAKVNMGDERLYVLLESYEEGATPQMFSIPWTTDGPPGGEDIGMEDNPYEHIGQSIELGAGGQLTLLHEPYQPPDLDKDKWYAENRPPMPLNQQRQ